MKRIKTVVALTLSVLALVVSSCKECRTCQCWKNGVMEAEQENCAYGYGSSMESLDTWERYLVERVGYDSVQCTTK